MGAVPLSHARLVALALPVTLSNLSTPLLGVVNAAAIGRIGDPAQLGAVALGAVIFDMLFWAVGFLRMSTAGLSAQAMGAGDMAEMRAAFWRALAIALAIGLGMILLRAPIADVALAFMAPSREVEAATRTYIDARILAAPAALANYVLLGSLIGRARTDLGLAAQIAINGANIGLSLLFVSVLHRGVAGAAWASVIAESFGLAIGLFFQWRAGLMRPPPWRALIDGAKFRRTLAVNRDIFLRTLAIIAAIAFFARQGSRAGDVTLGANALLYNLFIVGAFFIDGFAIATEQTAGRAVGAGDRAGFARATRLGAIWCLAFGAAASLAFLIGGGAAIDGMTTSGAVRAAARDFLPLAALAPLAGAPAFLFDGIFIGATWTRAMRDATAASFICAAGFYVATRSFGNAGLWISLIAFLVLRGAAQAAVYPRLERRMFGAAK